MRRTFRWAAVAGVSAATVGAIAFLWPTMGAASTSITFVPAAFAGAILGRRVGIAAGTVSILLTELALYAAGRPITPYHLTYVAIHVGLGGTLGWLHDVREQQREAAARDRSLFECNPVPVWVFDDATLKFLDVNEAAIAHYGYSRERFLAMRVTDLRPPEDADAFLDARGKRDRSELRTLEARHVKADGSHIDVLVTATNMRLDGREVVYAISQDVTLRKRADAALRRSERLSALGTLVAGVAHEINNPLTYMRGNVELAQMSIEEALKDPALPEKVRHELESSLAIEGTVLRGIDRIARITSSLRQIARRSDADPEPVDLDVLVQEAIDVARPRMPAGAQVRGELAAGATLEVVPGEISQVMLNLLLNAADAVRGSEEPCVVVRTRALDDAVVIEVEDNGPGIDPAASEKLFHPFFTTKANGTGLGLSISQRIVNDHGGAISVESAPGAGACFRVTLPLRVAGAVAPLPA